MVKTCVFNIIYITRIIKCYFFNDFIGVNNTEKLSELFIFRVHKNNKIIPRLPQVYPKVFYDFIGITTVTLGERRTLTLHQA